MEILESSLSGIPVLKIDGEVDHSTAPVLQQSVLKALRTVSIRVLLDLSACPFLDSGGLSVLLAALAELPEGGWLGVIGARPDLLRIFAIVGLLTLPGFRVFSDTEEAIAALQG